MSINYIVCDAIVLALELAIEDSTKSKTHCGPNWMAGYKAGLIRAERVVRELLLEEENMP